MALKSFTREHQRHSRRRLAVLRRGAVIPAHLLALDAARRLDRRRQRALTRYYLDAGAGGLAVGVHSTQFAIRDVGLYEPVLDLAAETARDWTPLGGRRPLVMIAGLAGATAQACREAETARRLGYHAGLLSLAAMKGAERRRADRALQGRGAAVLPLVGFYLQPAVGGIHLPMEFWRRFCEIDNVIAVKMAPFNRYRTLDVVRGVVAAGAEDRIALYTGNDDHIVLDLVTPFVVRRAGVVRDGARARRPARPLERVDAARGRAVRAHRGSARCARDRRRAARARREGHRLQQRRCSTSPTWASAGVLPVATRYCDGRGCSRASGASTATRG